MHNVAFIFLLFTTMYDELSNINIDSFSITLQVMSRKYILWEAHIHFIEKQIFFFSGRPAVPMTSSRESVVSSH